MLEHITPQTGKVILLASLGGALEFFDFTIYALFAIYISQAFFPSHNHLISMIETFAVFAVGYLARPLGGIFFGHLGDKKGRRFAFTAAVLIMALSTLLIGCLPSYQQWGITSPLLLVLLRLLQGFSVGGEIPGATIFTLEHVPKKIRGVSVAIVFMCVTLGNVLAALIGFTLTSTFTHHQMLAWGWRIPFFIGFLLGIISYLLRKRCFETPVFTKLTNQNLILSKPLLTLLQTNKRQILVSVSLTALSAATIFIFLYLPSYLTTILHYPVKKTYLVSTLAFITLAILGPLFGFISDIASRRMVIILGSFLSLILGYFLFRGLVKHSEGMPWLFAITLGTSVALVNGTYGVAIAEQFNAAKRYSGMGFSYNLGFALFGGLAPLISTFFIKLSGQTMAPYYFLLLCGLLTFIASFFVKKKLSQQTL